MSSIHPCYHDSKPDSVILGLTFNTSFLPSCLTSCSPLGAAAAELDSPAANKFLLTLALGVIPTAGAAMTFPGFAALGATTLAAAV